MPKFLLCVIWILYYYLRSISLCALNPPYLELPWLLLLGVLFLQDVFWSILVVRAKNNLVFKSIKLDMGVLNLRSSHTRAYLYLEPSFCRVFQGDTFVTENPSSLLLRFQKFVTDATPLWKMIETRGQFVYFPQTKSEIEPRLSISNLVKARHRFDPLVGYSWNASERERR